MSVVTMMISIPVQAEAGGRPEKVIAYLSRIDGPEGAVITIDVTSPLGYHPSMREMRDCIASGISNIVDAGPAEIGVVVFGVAGAQRWFGIGKILTRDADPVLEIDLQERAPHDASQTRDRRWHDLLDKMRAKIAEVIR